MAIEVLAGAPHIQRSRRPPQSRMHGRIPSGGAFSVIDGKDTAGANDRTSQARSQKSKSNWSNRARALGARPDVHTCTLSEETSPRECQRGLPPNDR